MTSPPGGSSLVVTAGGRACAIPRLHVIEVMRPLPVAAVAGMPVFVQGLSVIRGTPIPVVDLGALMGASRSAAPSRFVSLRLGDRRVALAVESVLGVRDLDGATLDGMPPLLHESDTDVVSAVGTLDERLLFVLDATRIVPEHVWHTLAAREARP